MIYTITFSPSIDYIIENNNNNFNSKGLTRVEQYYLYPGGKGINASYIINQINVKNKAISFSYGKTKELFINLLKTNNIKNYKLIPINSKLDIRINLKYFGTDTKYEVNGPSPLLSDNEFNTLKKYLKKIKPGGHYFYYG